MKTYFRLDKHGHGLETGSRGLDNGRIIDEKKDCFLSNVSESRLELFFIFIFFTCDQILQKVSRNGLQNEQSLMCYRKVKAYHIFISTEVFLICSELNHTSTIQTHFSSINRNLKLPDQKSRSKNV